MSFAQVEGEEMPNRLKKRTQIERMIVAKTLVESVLDEVREGIVDDGLFEIAEEIKQKASDIKINVVKNILKGMQDG